MDIEGRSLTPRLSIGIAMAPLHGTQTGQLMRRADLALYRAKAEGGHTHRFYDRAMEDVLRARQELEADLRRALAMGEFELFYQPLLDARSNVIAGFEALIRWRHPTRGLVPPGEFIPVAEETGLIVPMGEWVLERACADAMTWPGARSVAVNLSAIQFKVLDLVGRVDGILKASGLDPRRLELEITESVLLHHDEATTATLHALRALGVRIAMDDFGTGYSSLSYLRSFPFDKIKIDRSFVQGLGTAKDAEAIVRAVTMLGTSLGMAITAEGVETHTQSAKLKAEGCTQLQGYLISPPLPAGEVVPLIEQFELANELAMVS